MKKSTVHLFVFDTMSDWEYGYLIAGINNPQFQKTPGRFKVKTVSLSDKPIATMGGLRVIPDLTLDKLKSSSSGMLVLPGGKAWDMKKNKEAAQLAADFLAKGTPVAAICGATAGLGENRPLGRRGTHQQLKGLHCCNRVQRRRFLSREACGEIWKSDYGIGHESSGIRKRSVFHTRRLLRSSSCCLVQPVQDGRRQVLCRPHEIG